MRRAKGSGAYHLSFFDSKISDVIELELPYVPPEVDINHLDASFRMQRADDEQLEAIKKGLADIAPDKGDLKGLRHTFSASKKELSDKFSYKIAHLEDGSPAALYGKMGPGRFGIVELFQNKITDEWVVRKTQPVIDEKDLIRVQTERKISSERGNSPRTEPRVKNKKGSDVYPFSIKYARGMKLKDLIESEKAKSASTAAVYDLPPIYIAKTRISPLQRLQVIIDILEQVYELIVKQGIIHRDLSFNNIKYDPVTLEVSIIDWGNGKKLDANGECEDDDLLSTSECTANELREIRAAVKEGESAKFVFNKKTETFACGILLALIFSLFDESEVEIDKKTGLPDLQKMLNKTCVAKDKDDLMFIFNHTINSPKYTKHREEILKLANEMTAINPDERCELSYAIRRLKEIKQDYLNSPDKNDITKLRCDVLDVNSMQVQEWLNTEESPALLKLKETADHIVLIDSSGKNRGKYEYAKIKRQLEMQYDLFVKDTVVIGTDEKALLKKAEEICQNNKLPIEMKFINMKQSSFTETSSQSRSATPESDFSQSRSASPAVEPPSSKAPSPRLVLEKSSPRAADLSSSSSSSSKSDGNASELSSSRTSRTASPRTARTPLNSSSSRAGTPGMITPSPRPSPRNSSPKPSPRPSSPRFAAIIAAISNLRTANSKTPTPISEASTSRAESPRSKEVSTSRTASPRSSPRK